MHAQIEILASLQTVDREIKEQTGRKQRLLDELRVTEKQIQSKKGEIDALSAIYIEKEKARVEKDRIFQDEGKKAMDKRMRMNRIKNTKELQALQREIELMRQTNGDLEEDLIKIMQEIEREDDEKRVMKLKAHLSVAVAVRLHLESLVKSGAIAAKDIDIQERRSLFRRVLG